MERSPVKPELSVILCTHNPRADYLRRTLDALRGQTLPREQWELRVIDNASREPLAGQWDLSWHPHARHVREEELGLTPARLRGLQESTGDLVVFVDDDNVLAADFLARGLDLARDWPAIGAFGGHIEPEFEQTPPDWSRPYWYFLAIREVTAPRWTNNPDDYYAMPYGAGLLIRRCVAEQYRENCRSETARRQLDRRGTSLAGGGDLDLVYTAHDLGLGRGLFPDLNLVHLMPKERFSEPYFENMLFSAASSVALLGVIHGKSPDCIRGGKQAWIKLAGSLLTTDRRRRRFALASWRGTRHGLSLAAGLKGADRGVV